MSHFWKAPLFCVFYTGLIGLMVFLQSRLIFESVKLTEGCRWSIKRDPFNVFAFLFFLAIEFLLAVPLAARAHRVWQAALIVGGALVVLVGIATGFAVLRLRHARGG